MNACLPYTDNTETTFTPYVIQITHRLPSYLTLFRYHTHYICTSYAIQIKHTDYLYDLRHSDNTVLYTNTNIHLLTA